MHDPLGHGAALKGRVGFRHHFYTGNPRSVTVVMPSVVNPKGRTKRLDSIQETWGATARAVYVVHNVSEYPVASHAVISEDRTPEDPYSYPQLMLVPESIGSDDGVARLIHTIQTVFEKINPDFAFFVNDHTYVIPEHLCKYLDGKHPAEDMYHGHAMKDGEKITFNSGAAGYILSRKTMEGLVDRWKHGVCTGETASKWIQGNPGLLTTDCMKNELGVVPVDTRHDHKYHRFHAFPLSRMVTGNVDQWYLNKHKVSSRIDGEERKSFNQEHSMKATHQMILSGYGQIFRRVSTILQHAVVGHGLLFGGYDQFSLRRIRGIEGPVRDPRSPSGKSVPVRSRIEKPDDGGMAPRTARNRGIFQRIAERRRQRGMGTPVEGSEEHIFETYPTRMLIQSVP